MVNAVVFPVHISARTRSFNMRTRELTRAAGGSDPGVSVIMGCEQLAVAAGFMFVMHLLAQRHAVRFTAKTLFLAIRTDHDAARAVEAHARYSRSRCGCKRFSRCRH